MGFPSRLHGDPTLDDPQLIKGMCSNCNQIREWNIVHQPDGSQIKSCKICGMKVLVKAPRVEQPKIDIKDEVPSKGGIVGFLQKIISPLGKDKK